MKRIIFFAFLSIFVGCRVSAQSLSGDVCIGVVCPDHCDNFSDIGMTRLSQKLLQIASKNGIASYNDGTFVLYPILVVSDINVVEGGMKNITVAKVDMTLNVVQVGARTIVGSLSVTLSGSGYSVTEATSNALSNIKVGDVRYADFLDDCKKRIFEYDEQNCSAFISKARALASQKQYEAALAKLAMYPESLPSYPRISEAIMDIYKEYQNFTSAKLIVEAKSAISIEDYEGAALILSRIDPESPSYKECLSLIETVKRNVSKEKKAEIEMEQQLLSMDIELEKHRIDAAKEIARAYYSNQPVISYTQLVK